MNAGLIKTFIADGTVAPNTFVKFSSADDKVVAASAATDAIIGVSVSAASRAQGERVDIQLTGVALVKMGGAVARGGPVTANSDGKGVAAAPAAGVNNRIGGFAMVTTADGDIADVLLVPGFTQGAGLE